MAGQGSDVLERRVIHARDVFIKEGEEGLRAYLIQTGMVRSFTVNEAGEKVEVARFGPGTIIGELCLVDDIPNRTSFEALEDSTVVTITRVDFEKKLVRVDSTVKKVFKHVVRKLDGQDVLAIEGANKKPEIDDDALKLTRALIAGMPPDRGFQYEKAILPHLNGLITAIKDLKKNGAG